MAFTMNHLSSPTLIIGLLIMASLDPTAAQIGMCYGRLGNNLPSPSDTVALLRQNNIQRVRIYDPDQGVLRAFSGSNIEVTLGVPNDQLQNIAASQANANAWVQNNIRNIPNVRFRYIAVGNEVSPIRDTSRFVPFVLPAMRNINSAVSGLGIRVSTSVDTGLVTNSFPPANGVFRSDVINYIGPIVDFLASNRAPLLVNVYPYFAYIENKAQIDLRYALFTSDTGVNAGGVQYQNLFYALVDAVYAALEKRGASGVEIVVSESGWPSAGGDTTSVENARIYNTNLVQRVRSGTPRRPGRAIETYMFSVYDENDKNPEVEKHFGVFLPNRQRKYPISFA